MADAPTKYISPTHPYNNAIIDSGTTGHSPQATIAWMNPKLTK